MENKLATEANVQAIAPVEPVKVNAVAQDDLEAKNLALEVEKSRLLEEKDNYKNAYLKEKRKKEGIVDDEDVLNDDDRLRKIAREEMSNSRLAEIARERDLIIKKALRENKELKLAQLNKTNVSPANIGTSSEGISVTSTSITPEQMAYFKSKNFTDKDIERYKKNLQRGGGR